MADRRPYVGGNWKMNLHRTECRDLAEGVNAGFKAGDQMDVAIFPAFPYLAEVAAVLERIGGSVKLGAQDVYFEQNGAFTGEVSASMLKDVGVEVVLVGHSERRHVLGENDELINAKLLAALEAGFEVILCVGEKLDQREAGKTDAVNMAQTLAGLAGVQANQMSRVTIAYEPVWAIGTGKTATAEDAQLAHKHIREVLAFGLFDEDLAQSVRIQYGGSVKPSNAANLMAQPDVDGGLVGGASLKIQDFLEICEASVGG